MYRENGRTGKLRWTTRDLTAAGLIAALLAASAWIAIPIGSVPVTLQVFVVLLAGLLLPSAAAVAAVAAYIVLGSLGVPVFAGGLGGLGVLLGPTGGYLLGFAAAAALMPLVRGALADALAPWAADAVSSAVGIAAIYGLGWVVLAFATGMGAGPAFVAGVAPFLLVDAVKAAVAVGVAGSIRRAGGFA